MHYLSKNVLYCFFYYLVAVQKVEEVAVAVAVKEVAVAVKEVAVAVKEVAVAVKEVEKVAVKEVEKVAVQKVEKVAVAVKEVVHKKYYHSKDYYLYSNSF
jgi:hypothetical protein